MKCPHAIFSSLSFLPPFSVQIFSSAPYSQTFIICFSCPLSVSQVVRRILPNPRPFVTLFNFLVLTSYPTPNPQAGAVALIACPKLFIPYIRCYPPCLKAVTFRNARTRHAVAAGIHLSW